MSPVFNLPGLKSNHRIRFLSQQLVKRSPVDLRKILSVKKGCNPVTLGLCIQANCYLSIVNPGFLEKYKAEINRLLDKLEEMVSQGFHGACWGYEFDWEARYARIPANQPTVVATGIVTNALFAAYQILGLDRCFHLCESASRFILQDLKRTYFKNGLCFSYSPFDRQLVFNASMKGARLLAQVFSVTRQRELKQTAMDAVHYVCSQQEDNGAWIYSKSKAGGWVDHYHTGYVIDCLDEYITCCGDKQFEPALEKGLEYYRDNFFEHSCIPKFYDKHVFPVDCTAAGQALLTLYRFKDRELGKRVACWMIENMQDKSGYFYYRKNKKTVNKTSFMRWSNAWMFAGLSATLAGLGR